MIEVDRIGKTFKQHVAVVDVSFRVSDGSITGLLGPNGAGKTTTLRIISATLKPDRGAVRVDGYDSVRNGQDVRSALGVLPDTRGLYPRLTTREHIEYFGRLHGIDGAHLRRRVDELLEWLDLRDLEHRRTEGFSAGERLKVAIARALVHQPRNLLLDEPTTGLDVMSTRSLRETVRRLRVTGCCVLISTHVMQEVAALCDQVVILTEGRVKVTGTPEELIRQTGKATLEDAFVAAIGTERGLEA